MRKTDGGKEFYNLDNLGTKLRSNLESTKQTTYDYFNLPTVHIQKYYRVSFAAKPNQIDVARFCAGNV